MFQEMLSSLWKRTKNDDFKEMNVCFCWIWRHGSVYIPDITQCLEVIPDHHNISYAWSDIIIHRKENWKQGETVSGPGFGVFKLDHFLCLWLLINLC